MPTDPTLQAISKLDQPVDPGYDHILGSPDAPLTLVEYGSYDCKHCRTANDRITDIRNRFGDRLCYVYRHRPITGNEIARRAAELVERVDPARFWDAHIALMSRSTRLNENDLHTVAAEFGSDHKSEQAARERVDADELSAQSSGVMVTPTFFINGRRYDGPWDESALTDALLGSLGHRMRTAALEFASWAPSAGVLLLLGSILAIILSNSAAAAAFEAFWERPLGFSFGDAGFSMSLRHWINDGLLTLFFLVVGLEIKREFTVGHLASRRSAALPIAAAIGGMVVPAGLYVLVLAGGQWSHGWGVPMATDTAFAIAVIAMLGHRVPVELRIFLTAAAIVDDIGAITVVAVYYSTDLEPGFLLAAAALTAALALLNYSRVYRATPYLLVGLALWSCVHAGGVHATLAGVILALFIPTRPPPDYRTLAVQADAILAAEARHGGEVLRQGASEPALRALDAIHDRLESPAARLLRHLDPHSSYVVLPLFALANAGVALDAQALTGREPLMLAIALGLIAGKPAGILLVSMLAVRLGLASKPHAYSWQQLAGAGSLAGIGFTMSLFIASQAFPAAADFAAAKIAVFSASILSAVLGTALLFHTGARNNEP